MAGEWDRSVRLVELTCCDVVDRPRRRIRSTNSAGADVPEFTDASTSSDCRLRHGDRHVRRDY